MNLLSKMILSSTRKLPILFLNLFSYVLCFPYNTERNVLHTSNRKVYVGSWMQINRGFGVELGAIVFHFDTNFMLTN